MGARSPKALGRTSPRGLIWERWRECSSLPNTRKLPAPRVRGAADSPALRETAAPAQGAGQAPHAGVKTWGRRWAKSTPIARCLFPPMSARQPEDWDPFPPEPPARAAPALPSPQCLAGARLAGAGAGARSPEPEPRPRTGAARSEGPGIGRRGGRSCEQREGRAGDAALQLTLSRETSGADHTCYQSGHIPNHSTTARQPGASSYRKVLVRRTLLARTPALAGSTRLRPAPVLLQPGRPAPHPSATPLGSARRLPKPRAAAPALPAPAERSQRHGEA